MRAAEDGSVLEVLNAGRLITVSYALQACRAASLVASAALALLLAGSTPSHAAMMSAQDLIAACSGDNRAKATCDGYLMAVTDLILQRQSHGRAAGKICVPETITQQQVRDAVLNVAQHPRAAQADSGTMLVLMAMRKTFPCANAPYNGAPKDQ